MKNFVGSKGGAGIAQWLITAMPAHTVYVEAFLGRGVVMNTKRPALLNIGIESDVAVIDGYWRRHAQPNTAIVHGDAVTMLPALKTDSTWLVYADPPYLMSVRSSKRRYYGRELDTDAMHDRLLSILTGLQCNVMISGYRSELYSMRLAGWRTSNFWTVDRRGNPKEEICWMNFPEPIDLHDARFVGTNFTDRQRIKRKCERWRKKFAAMSPGEKMAILDALRDPVANSDDGIPNGTIQPDLLSPA